VHGAITGLSGACGETEASGRRGLGSVAVTWWPVWKQSSHGPSLIWTWNSSIRWACSVEVDNIRNAPR